MTNSDPTTAPAPVATNVSVDVDSVAVAFAFGAGVVAAVVTAARVVTLVTGMHAPGLTPPHPELYCPVGHEVGHCVQFPLLRPAHVRYCPAGQGVRGQGVHVPALS